ncbi:MAG: class I SAM-dependent methyltransferase [bacterium]
MLTIKNIIKSFPFFKSLYRNVNNQCKRDDFVISELKKIQAGKLILDAGCGSQRYRQYCQHLTYKAQDFGQYTKDLKKMIGSDGVGGDEGYKYGALDYIGDVWDIKEQDNTFDAILCTEVFEHIPYPIETIKEFSRLLKKDGKLILTAPSNCMRHMDPYFFYSGFTDRWYEKFLKGNGYKLESITAIGDYYSWLAVEIARTAISHSIFAKLALMPAFLYFYNKTKTQTSVDTLCMGYHVVATKI